MSFPNQTIIALGSNLSNPAAQIRAAVAELAKHPEIEISNVSSLYLSEPVGYADQPDFINAVCIAQTSLEALALLDELNRIETLFGRERSFRNAPRTLDLDIIDFNGIQTDTLRLTLPHPRAHERSFVMQPLAEILPTFCLGGQNISAADLSAHLGNQGIRLLEAF